MPSEADKKIIEEALERWKLCEDASDEWRRKSLSDIEFCDKDDAQWEAAVIAQRRLQGRPCLTINTTQQFVKQVVNDMRQNMPSIHVAPVEDSDEEVADIYEGLCRHIEVRSNASVAYDTAATYQVKGGLGWIRVVTDYESEDSFNQEIRIVRVKNPFSVSLDPYSVEPDGSDAMFGFIVEDLRKSDFKNSFKDSEAASTDSFTSEGNAPQGWMGKETIRVAEYFTVESDNETIHLMSNGSIITDAEYKEFQESGGLEEPVQTRTRQKRKVMWYKLTCDEILERKEWAGKYIPLIPVIGEENEIDGKRDLVGLVRRMKDPQRMVNYWENAKTETIALAPKAPFIAAVGQIAGFEKFWENANNANYSVLPYKPMDINGTILPPPQRQQAEAPVQTIVQATESSYENMKRTSGLYNASMGAVGNETSGKAILARQKQGDTANFHFIDNLSRSIRHVGVIIVDLIPKIYDAPRIVRVLGVDGTAKNIKVNQPSGEVERDDDGNVMEKVFDLTTGKFDVVVETGPSYNTKREQAVDSMIQVSQANPAIWQQAGDLIVEKFDWPGAKELSERLKKFLPPQAMDESDQKVPPQVQAQLAQAQQMIQQLTEALNKSKDESDAKILELESKERIANEKNQTDVIIAAMRSEMANNIALLQAELAHLSRNAQMIEVRSDMQEGAIDSQDTLVNTDQQMPVAN